MPKYRSAAVEKKASDAIERAKQAIASPPGDPAQLLALAKDLARVNCIGYARKVLEKANIAKFPADNQLRMNVEKNLALFTYKDQELPPDDRLKSAERMLKDLLAVIPADQLELKQDTWGILGAVYKMRWNLFASRDSLEDSLKAYLAGSNLGLNPDGGAYTALNAAFVLDLLAADAADVVAENRRNRAVKIREEVITVLTAAKGSVEFKADQWLYAKLGEAYLGSGQYPLARGAMEEVAKADLSNWELETMARQMAHLARLQAQKEGKKPDELEESDAWSVVKELLGGDATATLSFFHGKVGLALSGGGFRASLYHIGVFASLAERDMLRHVEVISCVSGGAILGMHYYLKLKNLLESKDDSKIGREDYVSLVQDMESEFLEGVQRNLRMRMLAGPSSNWKVLNRRASSTTNRLGQLYESELYGRIKNSPLPQSMAALPTNPPTRPQFMDDLIIGPVEEGGGRKTDFYPRYDNWWRRNKVPILVLNSTVLNTCHNWQFTATFMGEPPQSTIDAEIDANDCLRRMYYSEAPHGYKRVPIGDAVAASACVPGLFYPLVLDRLYKDYVVRLVDGGVFDNQGIASLQEQNCTVMLVSDGSGQTAVDKDPASGPISVAMRSNNVLMARVRQCEHQLLRALCEAKVLRGMMYLHLKKDLEASPVDWIDCSDKSPIKTQDTRTSYKIRRDVQTHLAAIRTDLDSFANCEADALMLSGYRAAEHFLPASVTGFRLQDALPDATWRFKSIAPIVEGTQTTDDLTKVNKLLEVAHSEAFKAFNLLSFIKPLKILGAIAATAIFVLLLLAYWRRPFGWYALSAVFAGVIAVVLNFVIEHFLVRLRYRNSMLQWLASFALCFVGGPFLWFHLNIVDRHYINWGPQYRPKTSPKARPLAALSSRGAEQEREGAPAGK